MSKSQEFISTRAFAEKAGVSAGTVSKWLRSGKITGKKTNGKWRIAKAEIRKISGTGKKRDKSATAARPAKPATSPARQAGTAYTVEAFSEMTYLTEFGVKQWLKSGRLVSAMDEKGRPGVAAASLGLAHIKRLLR